MSKSEDIDNIDNMILNMSNFISSLFLIGENTNTKYNNILLNKIKKLKSIEFDEIQNIYNIIENNITVFTNNLDNNFLINHTEFKKELIILYQNIMFYKIYNLCNIPCNAKVDKRDITELNDILKIANNGMYDNFLKQTNNIDNDETINSSQ
jgi:hypothetical protein